MDLQVLFRIILNSDDCLTENALICIKYNDLIMYKIIQHSHSGIMWLVMVMLTLSVIFSLVMLLKKDEGAYWSKFFSFTKWLMYIQALLGITLMFISPLVHFGEGFMKNAELRFYGMEHPLMMLIAIGLVSIGLFKTKKKDTVAKKNKTVFIFYVIALAVMGAMIPWSSVMS